jgi:uncharacterized protein (DUF2267 family)
MSERTEPKVLERSVAKTREWIGETAAELGHDDRREAYRALKGVLHVLRDRIPVNEAAQLAAQLPELLRGAYYENWTPARTPATYRDRGEFLRRVAHEAGLAGETEASFAVNAVMRVLARHVSAGEVEDVLAALPAELRNLLVVR